MKAAVALIISLVAFVPSSAAEPTEPAVTVTARRPDTRATVAREGDATILDVTCPFGIDRATVRRTGAAWPNLFVVRLRLKGLESFNTSNGRVAVEVAASRDGEPRVRASVREGEKESPIDETSPFWPKVRVVRGDDTDPSRGGSFEVTLPRKLFDGNPEKIHLAWVDFYRG